jgi:hypothetical protein
MRVLESRQPDVSAASLPKVSSSNGLGMQPEKGAGQRAGNKGCKSLGLVDRWTGGVGCGLERTWGDERA